MLYIHCFDYFYYCSLKWCPTGLDADISTYTNGHKKSHTVVVAVFTVLKDEWHCRKINAVEVLIYS